jgi:hypothetical protein
MTDLTAQVTSDVVDALGGVCDLEGEVRAAFTETISQVLGKYYIATEAPSAPASGGKISIKKKGAKKASNRKPSKNPYHFFVAATMPKVKEDGVEPKQRMKRIGELWKATDDEGKAPFTAMAEAYNAKVAELTAEEGWVKEDVHAAAQEAADAVASSE